MTTVRTPAAPSPSPARDRDFGGPGPPPRRPRNLAGAALGLLLVVFCATAVAVYGANAGHRKPVLLVVRSVRAGAPIEAVDIGEARVAADPSVHAMAVSERAGVIGRIAAVDLVSGTLLTRAQLATGPTVPPGSAVVGLNVRLGYAPTGLHPSDRVRLVLAPAGVGAASDSVGQSTGGGTVLVSLARVFDVTATPDGQGEIVSVIVDAAGAPIVAADGARGQVSVVLLGGSG